MIISWTGKKNQTNYSNSQNNSLDDTLLSRSKQNKTVSLQPNLNFLSNADTNTSSQIFQDDIPLNSSFLSECEDDFDFLANFETQISNPFESLEIFIEYFNKFPNKKEISESILQDKNITLSLFQTKNGVDIIIYLLQSTHNLLLFNVVIYYLSLININQQEHITKLLVYLYNYGNNFIRNQIISLSKTI
jgi:hypothetical protein